MVIALIVLWWVACGVGAFGFTFAHFQGRFSTIAKEGRRFDQGFAAVVSLFGPLSLVVAFCMSGFGQYGWRLR